MICIETLEDSIHLFLYEKKAKKLDVSKYMLMGRRGDGCINIYKLINNSSNISDFRNRVISDLDDDRNTDYLHLSLIMGLYFGCFNIYNYMYIKPKVRKKILESNPNREDTREFMDNHISDIIRYFKEEYNIDEDYVVKVIEEMFRVCDDDFIHRNLYNNVVVKDICMILMGRSLDKKFINCRQAIDIFLENTLKNKIKRK